MLLTSHMGGSQCQSKSKVREVDQEKREAEGRGRTQIDREREGELSGPADMEGEAVNKRVRESTTERQTEGQSALPRLKSSDVKMAQEHTKWQG